MEFVTGGGALTEAQKDAIVAEVVSDAKKTIDAELAGLDVGVLENRIEAAEGRIDGIEDAMSAQQWRDISKLTSSGNAPMWFSIGEQLAEDWTDTAANEVYTDVPMNIVHFSDNETDESGNTLKGMFLQWAYTTPFGIPFDVKEALYDVPQGGMAAGTYHFKMIGMLSDWAAAANNNKYFSFTLTEDLPEGYQLVLSGTSDTANFVGTYIDIYSSPTSFTSVSRAILSEGENGTYLGATDGSGEINHSQRAVLGYNRYMYSAVRQWLNSSAGVGEWWTKQHKWDRAPSQLNTYAGFLSGYSADFIAAMKPIKVQAAANTVTDGGVTDVMYDKVFLPSLEQMYINPQAPGKEGEAWEFYKQLAAANGRTDKYGRYRAYPELKSYAINEKTSVQGTHLRSANCDTVHYNWYVNSAGYIYGGTVRYGWGVRPACFV